MECFICSKKLNEGYLCNEHANKLLAILNDIENLKINHDWKKHCSICGEYHNRIIVEYKGIGYFCEKCIKDELERYS